MITCRTKKVGILDYDVGNINSLKGTIENLGYKVIIGKKEKDFVSVDLIFLPGVGSFARAIRSLKKTGMGKFIKDQYINQKIPIIGICLGMQILFQFSEEGNVNGLGILKGVVKQFKNKDCHVGWNIVDFKNTNKFKNKNIFFFNHSYFVDCNSNLIVAKTKYYNNFPAIIKSKRFTGIQFHPEKSQTSGENLLRSLIG